MSFFKCVIQDIDFLNIKFDFLQKYVLITSIKHTQNPHTKAFCRLNFCSTNLSLLILLKNNYGALIVLGFQTIRWQCPYLKIYDLFVEKWPPLVVTYFPRMFWISIGLRTTYFANKHPTV